MVFAVDFPDALVMIRNLSGAFEYLFLMLRYMLMVFSILWAAYSILNMYALSTSANGQMNRLMPSRYQTTMAGAWMQLVVASLTMLVAMTFLPLATGMSAITGEATITYYSVGSYTANTDNLTLAVTEFLERAFALIGLIAFARGAITWYKISNGEYDHKFTRVLGYFFFSLLCFNISFVNALIANTIGFDLLGFILN